MAETVTLELVCSRCGQWLMRWTADPDRPFGEQITGDGQRVSPTAVRSEAPGEYLRASDGQWRRWAPGPAAQLPDGEIWTRYVLACPNGCRTAPQARIGKLEDAAAIVLRHLHETRTPLLRTTVDSLLRYSA
jgi:hypothetical protein